MKKLIGLLLVSFLLLNCAAVFAQQDSSRRNNIIKINLTSIALKNYSLQYEHVVNHSQSFALNVAFSPKVSLPFKQTLLDQFGNNDDAKNAIESTKFTKISITPEYRFYLGKKGAPRGFYLAPFARYTHMTLDQDYPFTPSDNVPHLAHVTGKFSGIGGGIMAGAQWSLSKSITLDWWIIGPFIGSMNASFHGTDDMSDMSAQDKANLESNIESTKIPLWTIDATVGNNTIDAKLKGPFYGIRGLGFSLGLRF